MVSIQLKFKELQLMNFKQQIVEIKKPTLATLGDLGNRVGFFSKLYLVEVLPNIKIWRLAPNFALWKDFNYCQYSVEVQRTSTDEL